MKRLTYAFFICLYFSITTITHAQTQTPYIPLVSLNLSPPPFSSLRVHGPINVFIDAQKKFTSPSIQIFGDAKTVSAVTLKVKNQTLYLGTKWNYWPHREHRLSIKLNTTPSQLNQINFNSSGSLIGKNLTGTLSLTAKGKGWIKLYTKKLNLKSLYTSNKVNITLQNISSPNLTIKHESTGKINIQGDVALHTLNVSGNGDLKIFWLDVPYLKINSRGNEKIFLGGITKTLDANLSEKTYLFAEELRVENGFVKTQNQAYAKVNIKSKLNALARDNSIIYYSTPVNFLNTYTEASGIVLAN